MTVGAGTEAGGGSFFMIPGRRNVAGEIEGDAVNPLHPAPAREAIPIRASQVIFRRICDGRLRPPVRLAIGFMDQFCPMKHPRSREVASPGRLGLRIARPGSDLGPALQGVEVATPAIPRILND